MTQTQLSVRLITETFPPEMNGVAMTLNRLVDGLRAKGHRVALVRPRQKVDATDGIDTGDLLVKGLPIPRYAGLQFGLCRSSRLLKAWQADRPDLVHVATEGPLGLAAVRAADRLGIPVTSSFHTHFQRYGKNYGYAFLANTLMRYFRYFHNRTATTFVPSSEVREELAGMGFQNVSILSRGVDTQLFNSRRRCSELRRSWGCGESTPIVLYVGRIAAEKNLPLSVEAFFHLKQILPDAKMVWVGDGPERKKLAEKYPEFIFTGPQSGEALARHYASGDFFFFASTSETFGNVITEALASGLLVLAYDYVAAQQHIRPAENGMLARFDQAADFIAQVDALVALQGTWPTMRIAAEASVSSLSWDAVIDHFESALIRLAHTAPMQDLDYGRKKENSLL
ncbi:MAG: glycosyltransferase family 1 protein [Puniceicoccaceae bacterium]|nr:MAG: glycosyltransferase family 1 protein [Puniceicoccaceae bacterium]